MSNYGKSILYSQYAGGNQIQQELQIKENFSILNCFKDYCCSDIFHPFLILFMITIITAKFSLYFIGIGSFPQVYAITIAIFQFWLIKNIFGRKMAGLRWGTALNSQGQLGWRFQGWIQQRDKKTFLQQALFWGLQIGQLIVFIMAGVLTLSQLVQLAWKIGHSIIILINLFMFYLALKYRRQKMLQLIQAKGYNFLLDHKQHSLVVIIS